MDWLTSHNAAFLTFVAWLFVSAVYLPRVIANMKVLVAIVIVVGTLLAWLVMLATPNAQPWDISVDTIFVIVAALGAFVNSEVLFRRKNGYWRFIGRSA
jgi:hypothetical protein